jgi:hypothetical protein
VASPRAGWHFLRGTPEQQQSAGHSRYSTGSTQFQWLEERVSRGTTGDSPIDGAWSDGGAWGSEWRIASILPEDVSRLRSRSVV